MKTALLVTLVGCLIGIGGKAETMKPKYRKPAQSMDCTSSADGVAQAIAKSLLGTASPAKSEGSKDGGENTQYSSQITYTTKSSAGDSAGFKLVFNYNFDGPPSAGCVLSSINTAQ